MLKTINIIGVLIVITVACNSFEDKNNQFSDLSMYEKDSIKMIECDAIMQRIEKVGADTIGTINRIPNNFEDCLVQLDTLLNDKMKDWIRCLPDGAFGNIVHHSFGRYLRNNWGLWSGAKLSENLGNMGILHVDDMSGIILKSYQRKLKGEEIRLDEQLKSYQDFWRAMDVPVDSILEEIEKGRINQ